MSSPTFSVISFKFTVRLGTFATFLAIAASEMVLFTNMAVLYAAYCEVRVYSHVWNIRLHPFPNKVLGYELGRRLLAFHASGVHETVLNQRGRARRFLSG